MAATDISGIVSTSPAPFEFQQPCIFRTYDIDVTTTAYDGIETVATHNLIPIPKGEALVYGMGFVQTAFTSSGNATLTFQVGSDVLSGAIPKANLAVGDVIKLLWVESASTESKATYAKTAADTLDWVVGTAALTAGRIILVCGFVNVNAILTNG